MASTALPAFAAVRTGTVPARQWLWPLLALGVVVAVQAALVATRAINWDEFFHYSLIEAQARGEAVPRLQAPFVPLFGWVTDLAGNSIDHIRAIRWMMLPFGLVILAAIHGCARQFVDRGDAWLTALAYVAGGYVMTQVLVLRADPMATALLMTALWLVLRRHGGSAGLFLAGLLFAVAMVCTIKSVFYLFPLAGALLLRQADLPIRSLRIAVAVAAVAGLAGALLLLLGHAVVLPEPLAQARSLALASWDRMFAAGLFPNGVYLVGQFARAPFLSAMLVAGCAIVWRMPLSRTHRFAMFLFLVPLASAIVYRNSYPYHFVFTLAPAMVVVAQGAALARARYGMMACTLALLGNAAVLAVFDDRATAQAQYQTVEAVHQIFPEPVAYFDNSGMIGDYPRGVSHFASGWALAGYRERQRPVYAEAMERAAVPLLIPSAALVNALDATDAPPEDSLLPRDRQMIRDNFIPHWGAVHVAGKRIAPGTAPRRIDVGVPGVYTVEGAALTIDGVQYTPGSLVQLSRGHHVVVPHVAKVVVLRWGNHLARPGFAPPTAPLASGY